jgi:putative ABC transport system permease protein
MLSPLRTLVARFRFLLNHPEVDDESAEELRQHLELLTERYRHQGMPTKEAHEMARRQLGNASLVREDIYWMNRIRWWETLQQDVRYALRLLRRDKAFAVAAVLTLAFGIATTTVMFTLIHGVLLRPFPVQEQDRLVLAWREARNSDAAQWPFGDSELEAIAESSQLLEIAAGVNTRAGVSRSVVTEDDTSTYANVAFVTGGFFQVLGVQSILGRILAVEDDHDGAERVIVISSAYWQRRYGGTREVVGRRVAIGEQAFTIVGVMPPDLDFPSGVEIWRTTSSVRPGEALGAQREVNLIARLRPNVTVAQAQSELRALNQQLAPGTPSEAQLRGYVPVVRPFTEIVIGDVRVTLLALFGAVGLVLLIACANVANLLLIRSEGRRTELALRAALGAGRGRIVRQLFAESLVLSAIAGIAGFVLSSAALPPLVDAMPDGFPRLEAIRIDTTVAIFSIAVVFVTAMLAGATPALLSVRANLASPLRTGSLGIAGRSSTRGRQTLAIGQVALAVTVLAAAGLLVRSMLSLQAIDLGLAAERLVAVNLYMPPSGYRDRERRAQFLDQVIAQLEAVPAVASVTPVNVPPFSDSGWDVPRVTAEGQSADQAAANPSLNLESIFPNYFKTIGAPIIRGRNFTSADTEGKVPVAIVSEDAASRLWRLQDPIGKRIKMGGVDSSGRWIEVVGVAAPTRYRTVTAHRPTLYLPAAQFQMTATILVARTTARLDVLTSVARARIHAVDPSVQVMAVTPFSEFLDRPLARPRFNAALLGVFAIAALLLSTIGIYGVMAAYVRQRSREIAIRLALGATGAGVRRLVLGEAVRLAALGAALGVGGAMLATRFLRGMLFDIHPLDPGNIAGAAALLVAAAALASYEPVRRAVRADVMTVLRNE